MTRTRLLVIAVVALSIGILIGITFSTRESGPNDRAVAERCEKDVLARLAAPSTAKLTEVTVANSELDPETTDLSALSRDTLKAADRASISVRTASGVVQAPNAFGETLNDPFTCRAYFVDGNLVDTLVVFSHDH